MMFIINFEYVTDEENVASPEKCKPILPSKFVNRKLLFECSLLLSGRVLTWATMIPKKWGYPHCLTHLI